MGRVVIGQGRVEQGQQLGVRQTVQGGREAAVPAVNLEAVPEIGDRRVAVSGLQIAGCERIALLREAVGIEQDVILREEAFDLDFQPVSVVRDGFPGNARHREPAGFETAEGRYRRTGERQVVQVAFGQVRIVQGKAQGRQAAVVHQDIDLQVGPHRQEPVEGGPVHLDGDVPPAFPLPVGEDPAVAAESEQRGFAEVFRVGGEERPGIRPLLRRRDADGNGGILEPVPGQGGFNFTSTACKKEEDRGNKG